MCCALTKRPPPMIAMPRGSILRKYWTEFNNELK